MASARLRFGLRLLLHLEKDRLVEFPRAVCVGVRESRFAGCGQDAELLERRLAAGQSQTDLAQRVQVPELAKEHGHELLPTGEALGSALCLMLLDRQVELSTRNQL